MATSSVQPKSERLHEFSYKKGKKASRKKELSIPDCARLLEQVIKQQCIEEELMLIGIADQLHLDPDCKSYGMEKTVFCQKSQKVHHATINITKKLPVNLQDMFAEANAPPFPKPSVPLWKTLISSKFHSQSWLECTTMLCQFYSRHRII